MSAQTELNVCQGPPSKLLGESILIQQESGGHFWFTQSWPRGQGQGGETWLPDMQNSGFERRCQCWAGSQGVHTILRS